MSDLVKTEEKLEEILEEGEEKDMLNDDLLKDEDIVKEEIAADQKEEEDEDEDHDEDLIDKAFSDEEEEFGEREKRRGGDPSKLDRAPAYVNVGPVQVNTCGTFNYLCTRNNNFSNRSQKGKVIVSCASG